MDLPDVIAYVDEAGEKGYSRNLTPDRDAGIGLICALVLPIERLDEWRAEFQPGFDRFQAAAPSEAKIHITDAFRPENAEWGKVAREVREEFMALIKLHQLCVVYDARRLGIQRRSYEQSKALEDEAFAHRRSMIKISRRSSDDRIEDKLMEGLFFKLDALADDCNRKRVDLYLDQVDDELVKSFERVLVSTQSISGRTHEVKGWDTATKKQVFGQITMKVVTDIPLNVRFIGGMAVIGKGDPLILAVDLVANSLFRHLSGQSPIAPLNAPSSIAEWELGERVYGVRDDAIEDKV